MNNIANAIPLPIESTRNFGKLYLSKNFGKTIKEQSSPVNKTVISILALANTSLIELLYIIKNCRIYV
jgi:hypothetical protein